MKNIKWYFKNEKKIMKKLGFEPVAGSGSNWLNKEDGENDFFLAQLKSTNASSYSIKRDDLDKLEYHAAVAHKVPIFVVQFIDDGKIYLTIPAENIDECIEYWNLDKSASDVKQGPQDYIEDNTESTYDNKKKIIKSGNRNKYNKLIQIEKEKENEKWKKKIAKTKRNKFSLD